MAGQRILVLGASGYIGPQLVPALLEKGCTVRAAGNILAKFEGYAWAKHSLVEVMEADVLNKQSLHNACRGCKVIYYLVHSMNPYNKDFVQADRQAAANTVEAAEKAGAHRIIYLGGLGEDVKTLSKHLRSRMEVLRILHSGRVPVTSLRAAMVIGRGSVSFDILGRLVDRLPVIIAPGWVATESQPIAAVNVIGYLTGCLDCPSTVGQVFDIGGMDILSYRRLIDIYAEESGLKKRMVVPVPQMLVPALRFLWMSFVAPYSDYIVRPLFEGLRDRMVCQDNRIREIIPQKLLDCCQAIRLAIKK